jgi:hypothetical protein
MSLHLARSAQRTRFQLRRTSEREEGVCCKPELASHELGVVRIIRVSAKILGFDRKLKVAGIVLELGRNHQPGPIEA